MRSLRNILTLLLAGACLVGTATAGDPASPNMGPGSKARQFMLAQAIDKLANGTLVAELNRNKSTYLAMNPEQRRVLREQVLAYLKESPDRQAELLNTAQKFAKLTPEQQQAFREREEWLPKVVKSLSAEELKALQALPPAERSLRLLELKAKLDAAAPASADKPTTAPALTLSPTTAPTE